MDGLTLFESGTLGYAVYRIPALLALPEGRILAFCEGRRNGPEDYGEIRTLCRISTDGGRTFGEQRVAAEDGKNTVGNPTPVFDPETGRVWLFLNGNLAEGPESLIRQNKAPRTVLLTHSDDLGETWEKPVDLTVQLKPEGWTWYACGPGHALMTRSGRIVIPCDHNVYDPETGESPGAYSHTVYSDDRGASWQLGESIGPGSNESTAAELPDGTLYLNMRSALGEGCRAYAVSRDDGRSWSERRTSGVLPCPGCEGSVLSVPGGVVFSNAADPKRRVRMTVRFSGDGENWRTVRVLHDGCSAYSDLCVIGEGVGCLYECGESSPYERIVFERISLNH